MGLKRYKNFTQAPGGPQVAHLCSANAAGGGDLLVDPYDRNILGTRDQRKSGKVPISGDQSFEFDKLL